MSRAPSSPYDALSQNQRWWVVLIVSLGVVASILPSGSFNVAIPALMKDFGLGHDSVQFVVTTFMVTNTVAMLAAPWLIQRFGLRRCFEATMAVLLITSLVGSLSPSFNLLLGARLIQGSTAAMMAPMGSIVVMRLFTPDRQGRAYGINSLAVTLALALAPALAGLLVDLWGWRAVSLLPLPVGLLAWWGARRLLFREPLGAEAPFDWMGMGLLSLLTLAWLACFSRPGGGPSLAWSAGCMGVSLLAIGAFVLHLQRSAAPILGGGLFQRRTLMLGGGVSFLTGFGMYGAMYLMPVFLQSVMGLSASHAGAAQIPGTLALSLTFPVAGILADRWTPHKLMAWGLAVFTASFVVLWHYGETVTYLGFILITIVGRIGQSFALTPINKAALANLHGRVLSEASMLLNYLRQLGGVLGVAGAAAYVEWRAHSLGEGSHALATAFSEGYLVVAVALALAILVATRMGR
ncbi:MFS transporter [Denitratisoma oestradiolicum]|uniref:Major facilitator superfamily (MFS) profile domain-containing protein n=1 Tax=Denitratisoma oestradiolicum TaxID=311182 RepID=A0A6S6Y1M4_9PROT|nr:MFS transporter [Denitratisoma oestradiolicum]TWO79640.1 hypothetical protein CBW56_13785 [Denitratisoma oestradiolicum]CAB1370445.1 conserved membrane protein of unknown function [Denitratisoma oestradiolicum]